MTFFDLSRDLTEEELNELLDLRLVKLINAVRQQRSHTGSGDMLDLLVSVSLLCTDLQHLNELPEFGVVLVEAGVRLLNQRVDRSQRCQRDLVKGVVGHAQQHFQHRPVIQKCVLSSHDLNEVQQRNLRLVGLGFVKAAASELDVPLEQISVY